METKLNERQYEAVTATDDRLLFIAGAGVGKTTTLVHRVAYLIENGVSPENILLLTFTNDAANSMVNKIDEIVGSRVKACTFHSFCHSQLKLYAPYIGISRNFTVLSQANNTEVVKMKLAESRFKENPNFPNAGAIADIESLCFNLDKTVEEVCDEKEKYNGFLIFADKIKLIIKKAKAYRWENGLLNFDDLLELFIKLLKENPSVRNKIRDKYVHIMIDEYQDTNIPQDEIIDLLDPHNLVVVGDDYQALYAFRGATVDNILNFPQKHSCRMITLDQNYRSNQYILDLANDMMRINADTGFGKELKANHDIGKAPVIYKTPTQDDEAELILALMEKWTEDGRKPSELCILVRASNISNILEKKLTEKRIPYEKRGGPKFFDKKHVQDALALLNLYCAPRNEIAWFRCLMLLHNIGPKTARNLSAKCKDNGPQVLLSVKGRSYGKSAELLYNSIFGMIAESKEWKELFEDLCDYYVKTYRYNVKNSRKSDEEKEKNLYDLDHTIIPDLELLQEFSKEYDEPLDFINNLTLDNKKTDEEKDDSFIISTIHSAKGLEFKGVILMGATEGLFPVKPDIDELRCYYVALTRPKYFLVITSPESFRAGRDYKTGDISSYLKKSLDNVEINTFYYVK